MPPEVVVNARTRILIKTKTLTVSYTVDGVAKTKNDSAVAMPSDAWAPVFKQLKDKIRLRQYSPKTLKIYRVWIEQFKETISNFKTSVHTHQHSASNCNDDGEGGGSEGG